MSMYHHLNRNDRVALAALIRAGYSQRKAARELGINQSTISRELKRSPDEYEIYSAIRADWNARERRKQSKLAYRKIENNNGLAYAIEQRLHPLISPEVIAHDIPITHESIYAWIYRSRPDLKSRLPQRGKKRRRYGSKREQKQGWTKNVRSIEYQPIGAVRRSRIGHFEGDTMRGQHGSLLTLTDRKSRFEAALKIPSEECDPIHEVIAKKRFKLHARSFTFDRGSGFALWRMIERDTGAHVYFAHPHAPWERGTNENTNGRLRRVFPKKFDFGTIIQKDVDRIVWIMNHTKRKCLNWRTPCEVFKRCCTSS